MARTFNLRKFVLKTLRGMKDNYSEFQVREYALNWYEKNILTDRDMEEIESWYTQFDEDDTDILDDGKDDIDRELES